MWKNRLKELLYILENSNVNEIDVTFFGVRYRVVKEPSVHDESLPAAENEVSNDSKQTIDSDESVDQNAEETKEIDGVKVLSPMPGTFYISPSPDEASFVNEGDSINKGDTLCIIEAMKIMNEIEAEENGIIHKILVENGHAVEFNQPLFLINPK
ncbi:MAG: acetyl-CoA carboxylase, biotin carboxyl carrier protein [Candidatus Marinimicrobia bacterium]|jgi:acetyl-CoA carboxylase biotin carboxyl carrier protein|nr:acetyl-CoA carboxylase, biotin carboxyl carrier protein [Candidatus Neomarinimicrobiota bacterium]MBI66936.1 acetyl-CoA carboxylase, biotin carboxyl carrier protein [Candidatus Neomarinimicrobiota bacterium]|tara:strand:- start:366 stop:830 length:465 start_codon:yes stop_codon:yes gene_type:complete